MLESCGDILVFFPPFTLYSFGWCFPGSQQAITLGYMVPYNTEKVDTK